METGGLKLMTWPLTWQSEHSRGVSCTCEKDLLGNEEFYSDLEGSSSTNLTFRWHFGEKALMALWPCLRSFSRPFGQAIKSSLQCDIQRCSLDEFRLTQPFTEAVRCLGTASSYPGPDKIRDFAIIGNSSTAPIVLPHTSFNRQFLKHKCKQ